MKHYSSDHIKNIVLLGGAKAGKTTLAECMMFEGGVIDRMGSVDDGNTVSDFHDVEKERKHSIFSSIMHTEWRGTKINILDTPGMPDFIGEVIPALRVCDTGILTVNAAQGVEVGTEIVMRYLRKYNKPTIMVINQLDHPKADYQNALAECQTQFKENIVVMQYPYNQGEGFNCIIDLLKMTMYKFPPKGGKPEKLPIPDEEKENANELHNTLVEAAAENDDSLMELYFEKGELDEDEMRKGLRIGMLNREVIPVFCTSAARNMGSGRMMGFIGNVAPSAGDMHPEETTDGNEIKVTDKDTTLFIFRTENEKHAGTVSYFKVCSGEVQSNADLTNTNHGQKVRMSQLYVPDGKSRNTVDHLSAGDIGATVKLKDTHTNDTLRSNGDDVKVRPIDFPESKIRAAVYTENQGDEEKLGLALNKMHASDMTLIPEHSKELKQLILHGQGGMHLQMAKWQLEHNYGVKVEYKEPRIPYRETIRSSAKADYRHKKQSGGAGQFGEVYMYIAPYVDGYQAPDDYRVRDVQNIELPWGGNLMYCSAIVGGAIDSRFLPAILKGINEVMEEGPLTGSNCRDVVVIVYDGKMHPVDSNEIAFKLAGRNAFQQAFRDARPLLMEPVYKVEILTPEEYTGDIMTDLQGRRAMVEGMGNEGAYQKITARVPLATMYQYANTLNSIAQGRASFHREFLEYAQVPGDVQSQLAKANEAEEA